MFSPMPATTRTRRSLDPIKIEIIRSLLEYGAQHMAHALWRSSSSTVVREVLDYSTALFAANGEMVAQSAQLPFQMMTMSPPLRKLVKEGYPFEPGDVVLLNDPYLAAAQHLPDLMVFRPLFSQGRLVGFAGAVAHMLDIGGGAAGSYLATATEIFQEGLRLPPVKIERRGRANNEMMQLIALNVRESEKVLGDLRAMIACTAIGEEAFIAAAKKHGLGTVTQAMQDVLDQSERMLRSRLARLPKGVMHAVDFVDDDGIDDHPIRLELALYRQGRTVILDFSKSSPQVKGPVNVTLAMTEATVNYVLMAAFGENIPKNDGCRRVVKIIAPLGTILNAREPAPVASRVTICHRLVDVILQALSKKMPEKVMAGYYGVSTICNIGGRDPLTHRQWIHFEIEVGGWGARSGSDGPDAFSAHIHNLANTPIEIVEEGLALRVERYELVSGSGGRGTYRGGLGLRRDIRVLQSGVSLNLLTDRCKFPPKGLRGGENGRSGGYRLNPGTVHEKPLPSKLANYPLSRGDVISMTTPGGGGFGPPSLRPACLRARDRREGKV